METPVLIVDHSLPAEHRLPGAQLSTASCELVVSTAKELVGRLVRTDPAIIIYDERSRWGSLDELRDQPWAYLYGANLHEAVALARRSMSSPGRLLVVAHSRPSAHLVSSGEVFFNIPPLPITVEATASEIARCIEDGLQVELVVVPAEFQVEVPPWPTEIVSAIRLTGGAFTQARDHDDLRRWVEQQVP